MTPESPDFNQESVKIKNIYKCENCKEYFDLANIPEKAYDFNKETVLWLCPSCYEINEVKTKKYYG